MFNIKFTAALLTVLSAAPVSAATVTLIAAQDFDDNSLAVGVEGNGTIGTAIGTYSDGTGLGWTAAYLAGPNGDNGPVLGTEDGDLIGVVSATSPVTVGNGSNDLAAATGTDGQWFHADDTDGTVALSFDTVDATGFSALTLGFSWAVNGEGYERDDFFDIAVNGTSVFNVGGDDLETGPYVDAFTAPPALDLSAFDGQTLDVVVSFSTSSGSEDIGFDNLAIFGEAAAIPLPTPALLLGAGLLALAPLRRRRG